MMMVIMRVMMMVDDGDNAGLGPEEDGLVLGDKCGQWGLRCRVGQKGYRGHCLRHRHHCCRCLCRCHCCRLLLLLSWLLLSLSSYSSYVMTIIIGIIDRHHHHTHLNQDLHQMNKLVAVTLEGYCCYCNCYCYCYIVSKFR